MRSVMAVTPLDKKKAEILHNLTFSLLGLRDFARQYAALEPSAKRSLVDAIEKIDDYIDSESRAIGPDSFEDSYE
jgi:hypothetical protein